MPCIRRIIVNDKMTLARRVRVDEVGIGRVLLRKLREIG